MDDLMVDDSPTGSGLRGRRTSTSRWAHLVTRRTRLWLGAVSAIAVVVLLGVVAVGGSAEPQTLHAGSASASGSSAIQTWLAAHRPSPGNPFAMGPVSAPVVVAEWGDFQCPFCRAFDQDIQPVLIRDYVDTGKVRFEWHDLAKLGPESGLAARGARAAARQGAFWPFHDELYRNQAPENSGGVTEESLIAHARDAGLDTSRFVDDFGDPHIAAAIEQDGSDAAQLGITHVPSFLVNDVLLVGAQSVDTLRQVIDAALAKVP